MKEICGLCSNEETTESRLIALASWMKENYGSTMIQALKTVLPIQETVRAKEKRVICLNISEERAKEILEELENSRCKARARLVRALLDEKRIDHALAVKKLNATTSVVRKLAEEGIIRLETNEIPRIPIDRETVEKTGEFPLTNQQEQAVEEILEEWEKPLPRPVLIEGVTGSGKTQVYMKLIEYVMKQGKQAIVLIPEIALTYQTVQRFCGRFGDKVSVINSRLSQGERYEQFKRARRGEIQIMVGPRSALFTLLTGWGLSLLTRSMKPAIKAKTVQDIMRGRLQFTEHLWKTQRLCLVLQHLLLRHSAALKAESTLL